MENTLDKLLLPALHLFKIVNKLPQQQQITLLEYITENNIESLLTAIDGLNGTNDDIESLFLKIDVILFFQYLHSSYQHFKDLEYHKQDSDISSIIATTHEILVKGIERNVDIEALTTLVVMNIFKGKDNKKLTADEKKQLQTEQDANLMMLDKYKKYTRNN